MALEGRTALVTGAAQGLGRAFSEILLQNGAKVSLLDVNEAAGRSLKAALDTQFGADRALFLRCDVQSEEQVKAAIQKTTETFGHIDIFCNNAGIIEETEWEKTVSVNLVGVIRGTYLALEHMNQQTGGRGGVVVNVASIAGLGPLLSLPVYTATKHGVVGFTRAMAEASKVSGYGLRFNTICPSFVSTDILGAFDHAERMGHFSHLIQASKEIMERHGMLEVSEVAKNFLQLVMDDTKNGEALMVFPKQSSYFPFAQLGKKSDK